MLLQPDFPPCCTKLWVGISSPVCCCQAFDKAGPYSYGLYSYSLYGYGLYTYGLHSYGQVFDKAGFGSALAKHVAVSIWVHPIFPKKKDVPMCVPSKHNLSIRRYLCWCLCARSSVCVRVPTFTKLHCMDVQLHVSCMDSDRCPASCKRHFSYHFNTLIIPLTNWNVTII